MGTKASSIFNIHSNHLITHMCGAIISQQAHSLWLMALISVFGSNYRLKHNNRKVTQLKEKTDSHIAPHDQVRDGQQNTKQVQICMGNVSHTQRRMKQSYCFNFYTTVPLGGWTMAVKADGDATDGASQGSYRIQPGMLLQVRTWERRGVLRRAGKCSIATGGIACQAKRHVSVRLRSESWLGSV